MIMEPISDYQKQINDLYNEVNKLRAELAKKPSVRDQFAMSLASGNMQFFSDHDVTDFDEVASDCYNLADAMIRARDNH